LRTRRCYIDVALKFRSLSALLLLAFSAAAGARAQRVVAVDVDGIVHPVTVEIISRALEQGAGQGAAIVLIRLNTPGGLSDAMRQIIEKIVASPVPVVTFVTPSGGRAASAGFFILEAGDVAAMAAGTNTGAATPVMLGGGEMDPVMRNKVQNDAAASIRSLAAKRGRNITLAEKTVLEAKSFTDKEALDAKLIDLIAPNQPDLFRQLNGREITRFDGRKQALHLAAPEVVEYQKTLRERIISAIADPNIALVLLILGALGIYVEFTSPGLVAPGVLGAILVLMGLSALSVLPINWGAAALIVLAFVLFVLEAKFTSHGVLTAGGTVAMVLGAMLLVESPLPEMRIHLATALSLALPFALVTSFLLTLAVRARRSKVRTGASGMIGETGLAYTPLAPSGKVFVHGEYWNAVSSAPVETGARVRVTEVEGLTLKVEPDSLKEDSDGHK
jgi:membrane-bound serine protease (ClpP class)